MSVRDVLNTLNNCRLFLQAGITCASNLQTCLRCANQSARRCRGRASTRFTVKKYGIVFFLDLIVSVTLFTVNLLNLPVQVYYC
jgi:hypothetical protein